MGTKLSNYSTVEDCRAQIQDNLRALRRDKVDVLLAHSIEKAKAWIPGSRDGELLDLDREYDYANAAISQALREAKAQGLCGSTILVGASTPEELEESVVAAQAGPLPPDIHQTLEKLAAPAS